MTPADVVWSYSGVRPLLDDESGDPSEVTRDYALELDTSARRCHVWGGKITTYRKLAEEAGDLLGAPIWRRRGPWTRDAILPGGDFAAWIGPPQRPDADFARFPQVLAQRHPGNLPCAAWQPPGARPRHAGRGVAPRDDLGAEVAPAVRGRARPPARQRVGAQRRRRALAAQQARPAPRRGPARRRRRLVSVPLAGRAARRGEGMELTLERIARRGSARRRTCTRWTSRSCRAR